MIFRFTYRKLLYNISIISFFLFGHTAFSQQYDHTWLFPQNAGIHFDINGLPQSISSTLGAPYTGGENASISDYSGNIIFYANSSTIGNNTLFVYNPQSSVMFNGDSLLGTYALYNGCKIIPTPQDTNLFYLFAQCINRPSGTGNSFYFSLVDPYYNNSSGRVIFRDSIIVNDGINDKFAMVHHANGRDWWLILQSATIDSLFYKVLIAPDSFRVFTQKIGTGANQSKYYGSMIFSNDGTKLITCSWTCRLEVFDFDRCTGELSNWINLSPLNCSNDTYAYNGCAISPSNQFVYATSLDYATKPTYKFDLLAPNPRLSRQIINTYPDTGIYYNAELGRMAMGPDNVIYIAKYYRQSTNKYLDAIVYPDSACSNCNYARDYFYLTYGFPFVILPQFPNFRAGREIGTVCDSLFSSIAEISQSDFSLYPNPTNEQITISTKLPYVYRYSIYNLLGKKMLTDKFTGNTEIDVTGFSSGIYFVLIEGMNGVITMRMSVCKDSK